jgi:protein-S-isoprenylcysteine O-methyltransferase Ste14
MGAVLVLGIAGPSWPEEARWGLVGVGALSVIGGALVAVSAARALGASLTPYPRPADDADVVAAGPYRYVRHPIYSGGILFFGGLSLVLSPLALGVTAALVLTWALKARVEERFLVARFATYAEYCARTPYRLVPFVY